MIIRGHSNRVLYAIRRRFWSEEQAHILRKDPAISLELATIKLQLSFRIFCNDDILRLPDDNSPTIREQDRSDAVRRRYRLMANVQTCYAAVTENGVPCPMIWLTSAEKNEKIRTLFRGDDLRLNQDEMLMEGACVRPDFRQMGILAYGMKVLPESDAGEQECWIITYISPVHVPPLRAAAKAGFIPYMNITETWRLFHKRTCYKEVATA